MAETQTQTQASPATSADSSSNTALSNAGSDSLQTSNTATVDSGNDGGKSTASDEASGAAGDGERRPGRAERRISELTKREKELESELVEKNSLLEKLSKTPVDQSKIQFPDYSGVEQITPEILKRDVLSTANQIVDARMELLGSALLDRVDQRDATGKSSDAIKSTINKYSVLNPDSDDYDHDLDVDLSTAYAEARSKNPTYSFTTFIKPFERLLEQSSTTEKSTSKTESNRGTAANRSRSTSSRSANEFPSNGSASDMEKWFAQNRG